MKKLFSILPLFAMVIALGTSFATTSQKMPSVRKALINGQWTVVTPGYTCAKNPAHICTQLFDSANQPIPNTVEKGDYQP